MSQFDSFAHRYEETLGPSCALSGEAPDFFARERLRWCRRRLQSRLPVRTVLDFGCGIGGSFPFFFDFLGCKEVVGVDPSAESLRVAEKRYAGLSLRLFVPQNFPPRADINLAFCNGVFHHIAPEARPEAFEYVRNSLVPGGIFAFWENNPWNPIVTYAMSHAEIDRDAQTISPTRAIRMLKSAGFRIQNVDFCFFFPHFARQFRDLEPGLRWLPVGGQYLVLAQKT